MRAALVIGNSDGMGLALTRRLLDLGMHVVGISRSPSPLRSERYRHHVMDVRAAGFRTLVQEAAASLDAPFACIYCAGMGEALDLGRMEAQTQAFEVNLMGLVATVEVVVPLMVRHRGGHIVGISSQADVLRDPGAPGYAASKAGMSSYLEAMAMALRKHGVHVTNIRFGFVDTKMAVSEIKPFLIGQNRAAAVILRCLRKKPIRYTYPRRMAALLWLVSWPQRLKIRFG